jgi:protein-L-isoaspartate(D-aspartate) O-methyltransferase
MIAELRSEGIRNEAVLQAMSRVPRHLFVPPEVQSQAYENTPLPIGLGQTISQPYIVAYMTEALQLSRQHKVLEIGTGSGYQAAVLADLAERARKALAEAGYKNVNVRAGNGYLGWPEQAPFPRIIVTAAPDDIPQALIDQLAVGGIMVVPVGSVYEAQEIVIVTKSAQGVTRKRTIPVRFVPMIDKPR